MIKRKHSDFISELRNRSAGRSSDELELVSAHFRISAEAAKAIVADYETGAHAGVNKYRRALLDGPVWGAGYRVEGREGGLSREYLEEMATAIELVSKVTKEAGGDQLAGQHACPHPDGRRPGMAGRLICRVCRKTLAA